MQLAPLPIDRDNGQRRQCVYPRTGINQAQRDLNCCYRYSQFVCRIRYLVPDAAQVDIEGTGGGVSSSEGVMITGIGTVVTSIDGDIRIIGNQIDCGDDSNRKHFIRTGFLTGRGQGITLLPT